MRTVLVLVGSEFRRFAADKVAISLTFIVPLVLIYIFGNVFGVNSEEPELLIRPQASAKRTVKELRAMRFRKRRSIFRRT